MQRRSRKQAVLEVFNELAEKLQNAAAVLMKTANADMSANSLTLCLKHSIEVLCAELENAQKKITALNGGK